MLHIQTGHFNCSHDDYSTVCRVLTNERFVLLVPSLNQRTSKIYSYDIFSAKHYDYQYILKWLSKTLNNHMDNDRHSSTIHREHRSIIEFRINTNTMSSLLPIHYFTLFYRYGSIIDFRCQIEENQVLQVTFIFRNSSNNIYVYNQNDYAHHAHEFVSFRSLNMFLSCLTINCHTLMSIYFIVLNIYLFYDIYLIHWLTWMKKIVLINVLSACLWSLCFIYMSIEHVDSILQMLAFYFLRWSQSSIILMYIRHDLFVYSIMSKWIFYSTMFLLHVAIGLAFRWYLREKFGTIITQVRLSWFHFAMRYSLFNKILISINE
jgi:hypothetical protein